LDIPFLPKAPISSAFSWAGRRQAIRETECAVSKLNQRNIGTSEFEILKPVEAQLLEQRELRLKGEDEARTVSARLIQVQEAERRAVARELHDQIGQGLTIAKLMLSRITRQAPVELKPALSELSDQISKTMRGVRQLALSLRPGVLDELGLVPALEWLFKQLESQAELKVEFVCQQVPELPLALSTATFRVVQEALTNVMRHSGVKDAKVVLSYDGKELLVSVTDQGNGFDQSTLSPGQSTGLSAMRERATLLGGKCECRSVPGHGTAINLTLPLPGS
jgi:signal transduction histidine kinase